MITEEEYLKAKAIVDEYEREEYEAGMRAAEEDEFEVYDDIDEDDLEEQRENDRFAMALNCSCGAWVISKDKTKVLHVADCICGAE